MQHDFSPGSDRRGSTIRRVMADGRAYALERRTVQVGRYVRTVYTAWEPFDGHSTITHLDDTEKVGKVGTRRLPEVISAMPYDDGRIGAVEAYHAAQDSTVHALLLAVFPETALIDAEIEGGQLYTYEKRDIA